MSPPTSAHGRSLVARAAFTLIELLVVVGVIVILIAILLPALAGARDSSRSVICLSNMRQIGIGLMAYAFDFKGQIWETGSSPSAGPPPTNDPIRFWYAQPQNPTIANTGLTGSNPVVIGAAMEYLTRADQIFSCPTNKRKAFASIGANGQDASWQTPQNQLQLVLFNEFLSPRQINFDYTMVTGSSGARVDSDVKIGWDTRCTGFTGQAGRAQPPTSAIKLFRACPVFIEEDSEWWNGQGPDGMYSNWDEVSNRHGKKGNILLANGDVEAFKAPRGPDDHSQNDVGDFVGNDIWARGKSAWFQVAPSWPGTLRNYGWVNQPR